MLNLGIKNALKPFAVALSLLVCLSLVLASGSAGTAAATSSAKATASKTTVAKSAEGKARSKIVGTNAAGKNVTGYFTPLNFKKKNGNLKVRGLINGVVHKKGTNKTFAVVRTLKVKSINGTPASARQATQALATCDILHLILGPLDLDLLGLKIHLDKVVLDIIAETGAGNLLGNLLCAVTGLLDGGLEGALGRLVDLLNEILGELGLGL